MKPILRHILSKFDSRTVTIISFAAMGIANAAIGNGEAAMVFAVLIWLAMGYFKLCDIETRLYRLDVEIRCTEVSIDELSRTLTSGMPKPPPGMARGQEDVL